MDNSRLPIPVELVKILRSAQSVAVLTGAGISAESGVPTFRDSQTGLWAQYNPEQLASPDAFRQNPRLVWDWYEWRRNLIAQTSPNPAHFALVEMEKRVTDFMLITQNVDGLHQIAGSRRMVELHGNIWRNICFSERSTVVSWQEADDMPPCCPSCGDYLRPDVVWFGEALPEQALNIAWKAAQSCDLFFSIGTSGLVHPAASLPRVAAQRGIPVVEINPEETPLTRFARWSLRFAAGDVLPALIEGTWNEVST